MKTEQDEFIRNARWIQGKHKLSIVLYCYTGTQPEGWVKI